MKTLTRSRLQIGTSLIELLVVIVIFLIGILAIAQVFPGGFRIIAGTRAASTAASLARSEMDRLRGTGSQIPEQIVPALYRYSSGGLVIEANPQQSEEDLGPQGAAINAQGNVLNDAGQSIGPWQYVSGPNNVRRVIGEGTIAPAPRAVGTDFGGLMTLQFGPAVHVPGSTSVVNLFIYGNDLDKIEGTPAAPGTQALPGYSYYVDSKDPTDPVLYIPESTKAHSYKLSLTGYVVSGGKELARDFIAAPPINVPASVTPAYDTVHIAPLLVGAGESLAGFDFESLRLARMFDQVSTFDSDNPYQYKLVNEAPADADGTIKSFGVMLINPAAYKFSEKVVSGQSTPLRVRADYDVFDWRIVKEDFRVPDQMPYEFRLKLTNLKHRNGYEPDNKLYLGLNVKVPDEAGGFESRDVVIMDLQTGGVYSKRAFTVDYSLGLIAFIDSDNNPANGIQVGLIAPGATAPSTVDAAGRAVRIYYEANGEWSPQVLMPAAFYTQGQSPTPLPGQYYVAPPAGAKPAGANTAWKNNDTFIRFPRSDAGKTVMVDELWYAVSGDSAPHVLRGQSFLLKGEGTDSILLITDNVRDAIGADFSNGYAVRGVKGASIRVRVLYNTASVSFGNDNAQNLTKFEEWSREWRQVNTESVIERGATR
jgi:type II secretory pathway pseudopilin PulG